MKTRSMSLVSALVLSAAVIGSVLVTPAAAKKPPKPPPPPPPSSSNTFVRGYAEVLNGVKCEMTPAAVQATSDGGSVALGHSGCQEVSWVVKLDASGIPQWQEEVGCFGLPPGGFSLGEALQQTADGGYVIAGGARDCGSNPVCPYLSSIECGLIEKLNATGRLVWARVYSASPSTTSISDIKETSDGGFVAVGSYLDADSNIGALALKLDSGGNLQWQRKLGPGGPSGTGRMHVYFNAVQPTADGGYVATGEFYSYLRRPEGDAGVLVVKLNTNGNVDWQRGFNSFDNSGAPTASEHASSIIQTSEGGYLVAGDWNNTTGPGTCCQGPLLLKLDANGRSQWQKAYSGGVYCFFNGYSYQCYAIGGLAYSVHQTSDGSYALAGAGDLKLTDGVSQVPWLAKVDASGNLLWQHFYYRTYPTTGRPLSQYFASGTLTSGGGLLALGFTENPTDLKGELFAVRTDGEGLVGTCSQIHPATPLDAIDPGLTGITLALPMQATIAAQGDLPSRTQATSIDNTGGGC